MVTRARTARGPPAVGCVSATPSAATHSSHLLKNNKLIINIERHDWRSGGTTDYCAACRGFDPRTDQILEWPTGSFSGSGCLCI